MRLRSFVGLFALLSVACLPATLGQADTLVAAATRLPAGAYFTTRLNTAEPLRFSFALPLRDEQGLRNLIKRQYDPNDSLFGHYLKPSEVAERFGPTQADYDRVVAYAESHGMSVVSSYTTRTLIDVTASVSQVEAMTGVKMYSGIDREGRSFHAPDHTPILPAELRSVGARIIGLDNSLHFRSALDEWNAKQPRLSAFSTLRPGAEIPQLTGNGPFGYYSPENIDDSYNLERGVSTTNPYQQNGLSTQLSGRGQTVAVVEYADYNDADISYYFNYFQPIKNRTQIVRRVVNSSPGIIPNDSDECSLDIELLGSNAYGADRMIVYVGQNSNDTEIEILNHIASDSDGPSVVSNSWGIDEYNITGGFADYSFVDLEKIDFEMIASEGISFFSSSGDNGAYDAGKNILNQLLVDDPASQPYVTGVGGTSLVYNDTLYPNESAWGYTSDNSGGGGGISQIWSEPSYQSQNISGNSTSTNNRNVPDVSLSADDHFPYAIYDTVHTFNNDDWLPLGGTSCATPEWAGFAAVLNQNRQNHGLSNIGFINPSLYSIYASPNQYANDFRDIVTGNNLYYNAAAGYDLATGLGAYNGFNLVKDLSGGHDPRYFRSVTLPQNTGAALVVGNDGFVYGVSNGAGSSGNAANGTFFRLNSDGSLTTLYTFTSAGLHNPFPVLCLGSDGNFYGIAANSAATTNSGLYKISTSGSYAAVGTFSSSVTAPNSLLQIPNGSFIGTAFSLASPNGQIFSVSTSGVYTLQYSFSGGIDGAVPEALVRTSAGTVYGVSTNGGANGGGTIFAVQTNYAPATLYSFPANDHPIALSSNGTGTFYGATSGGGDYGVGKIFSWVPNGAPTEIHAFSPYDQIGDKPHALIASNDGNLYGLTSADASLGGGALFRLNQYFVATNLFSFQPSLDVANGQTANANAIVAPTGSEIYGLTTINIGGNPVEAYVSDKQPLHLRSDLNGDGHSDIVWEDLKTGQVSSWLMNGDIVEQFRPGFATVSPDWHIVGTIDTSGNGYTDYVWWNSKTGALLRWVLDDNRVLQYGSAFLPSFDTSWHPVATMDAAPGGYWSLLWENVNTGAVIRWRFQGTTVVNYSRIIAAVPDLNWHLVATADLNGDGHDDYIWWNSSTGGVARWLMDDTAVLNYGAFNVRVTDTSWQVVAAPDLDGSGHPDLLWLNTTTGALLRWKTNDETITHFGSPFTVVADPASAILGPK